MLICYDKMFTAFLVYAYCNTVAKITFEQISK